MIDYLFMKLPDLIFNLHLPNGKWMQLAMEDQAQGTR